MKFADSFGQDAPPDMSFSDALNKAVAEEKLQPRDVQVVDYLTPTAGAVALAYKWKEHRILGFFLGGFAGGMVRHVYKLIRGNP
jgi:hypothetical protein